MKVSTPPKPFLALVMLLASIGCSAPDRAAGSDANAVVQVLMQDAIDVRGKVGFYTYGDADEKTEIAFPLPIDRINVAYFHDVERIGKTSRGIVAVLDTYGSNSPPDGRCADGREAWLRLFSIAAKRQLRAIPVESCLDRLAPGAPAVIWRGESFEINRSPRQAFAIDGENVRRLAGG